MMNVSAIGAGASYFTANDRKSVAVLNAQLAKYQAQLSDWVNCASCKTPEGKAKIAEISEAISDIKQRLVTSGSSNSREIDHAGYTPPKPSLLSLTPQSEDQYSNLGSISTDTNLLGRSVSVYA